MRHLTLYIPGLFGPDISLHPDDLPSLPALNWFFSRGVCQNIRQVSASYTLCDLFGLTVNNNGDYPIAAISRLTDDNQHPEGLWLRADPVHVSADRDGLILIDSNRFNLNQRDALALAADINLLFQPYGITIEVPTPTRWYLRVNESYEIKTVPIDSIVGKDILPFMPTGDDRINVIQLMNDIQMTLHNSDVNKRREEEKQLPINSVWFWGYGELPKIIKRNWSFVSSDEILAKGLAMVAATPFEALQESYDDIADKGSSYNGLIVLNSFQKFSYYHDLEGWLEALLAIEENWFAQLLKALKNKQLDQLTIRTELNEFKLDKTARYKFWKQKKTLNSFKN